MANAEPERPVEFWKVLEAEQALIEKRREAVYREEVQGGAAGEPPAPVEGVDAEKRARLASLDRHVAGLALSGGGIRSATFALGVLQGLADLKLLSRFDYLSTVSGGGYIGGWLAAWLKREGKFGTVQDQLSTCRITAGAPARPPLDAGRIVDEEPEPVRHLRAYSNYLTPRPGLLSVDTWTVLLIYIRNGLINLLLLLPLAMLMVLLGRLVVIFYAQPQGSAPYRAALFAAFMGLMSLAVIAVGLGVARLVRRRGRAVVARRRWDVVRLKVLVVWPLLAAAVLACWCFNVAPADRPDRIRDAPLADDAFELRLPDRPSYVHDLQPYIDATPFGFLKRLDSYRADSYDWWYVRKQFLWYSCLEVGTWFAIFALVAHFIGFVSSLALRVVTFALAPRGARDEGPVVADVPPAPRPAAGARRGLSDRLGDVGGWLLDVLRTLIAAGVAGFTAGFLFTVMASEILWRHHNEPYLAVTVGPPLALLAFVTGTFIEVWLLGRQQRDDIREWWARTCAWLVIYAAAWAAFFAVTLYGPMLANWALHDRTLRSGALAGWLATVAGGAFAGRKPEAHGPNGDWKLKALVQVAPPLFVAGLLIVVAMLADAFVVPSFLDRLEQFDESGILPPSPIRAWAPWAFWDGVITTPVGNILRIGAACLAMAFLASVMSNVNLFSLNSMYANRLTRCYLGASRRKRSWGPRGEARAAGPGGVPPASPRGVAWAPGPGGAPTGAIGSPRDEDPITGFDLGDDIPLWELGIGQAPGAGNARPAGQVYLGPQLIINTALNLVAGGELAWQDRKAESFTLSPTFCGSKGTGYARTTRETGRELTLGRAMSISGAAVDSNLGLHQSSALIALMTAFNARLGWWMKNPRGPGWDAGSPSLALPLLLELLGQTDERQKYIHVSDGGHFENLGVYELVRRRCRYIVCCDAGTDPGASDDNLANMIRLCRTDFGVRIEIDTAPFARSGDSGPSRWHCAVGQIRYDDVDGGELPGVFVLLRTTLTGDEPPDVQEYAARNPTFPWQSTADQFFDEAQFESYRALGAHVAHSAFKDALDDVEHAESLWTDADAATEFRRGNQRLFSAVQRRWAPAPPHEDSTFVEAAEGWMDFQEALGREDDLADLSGQIYPEQRLLGPPGQDGAAPPIRPELHAVAEMIQVMENAWVGLRLGGTQDLAMNRGWMSVFRRWASTDAMRRFWPVLRSEYSQDFVKFCEAQLGLACSNGAILRSDLDPRFAAAAFEELAAEYGREWPKQPPLKELLADAEKSWKGQIDPLPIWFFVQAPNGPGALRDRPDKFPCGIVFGKLIRRADRARKELACYEVFPWLRRAYRSIGLASRNTKTILDDFRGMIDREAEKAGAKLPPAFTIRSRFPAKPQRRGHEMEFDVWKSFFSHYDFRTPRKAGPKDEDYDVVERTYKVEEIPKDDGKPSGKPAGKKR